MRGFFVNYPGYNRPYFHSWGATSSPSIVVDHSVLDFVRRRIDWQETIIVDHRNGLLLLGDRDDREMCVCNPTTRRRAELPPPPFRCGVAYLVFDPVVSLHYDVLLFRRTTWPRNSAPVEWPPSVFKVQVYSSRAGQWEEWPFLREGDTATPTMWTDRGGDPKRHAVYWRGALYVHCRKGLIIRYIDH
jgi:hypothetical protein